MRKSNANENSVRRERVRRSVVGKAGGLQIEEAVEGLLGLIEMRNRNEVQSKSNYM